MNQALFSPPAIDRPDRAMHRVATGLLVGMAALFIMARALAHVHPAMGFVQAFAEAAMVGGLADWFAVTALFRHPLKLPIPHTAIIPRNKDRIGDTLASFLRDNFLVPHVVARRMGRLDIAGAAGRFLARPALGVEGRLRQGASRLVADMLEAMDEERLGGMAKGALKSRLAALNLAPLIGQALEAAMPRLREMMSEAGIAFGSATVSAGTQEQQDQGSREASGGRRGGGQGGGTTGGEIAIAPSTGTRGRASLGAVDTFA